MNERFYAPVAVSECREYDTDRIFGLLAEQAAALGITRADFEGKKIVIKPNLVARRSPEQAATTHPAVLEAAVMLIRSLGGDDITIAESPAGPFTEQNIRAHYRATGILEAAERLGVDCSVDESYVELPNPDGERSKVYNIIKPAADCDVLVDLCKVKTHTLTVLSAAVKNLFGTIPGIQKFEMHSRFPVPEDFFAMVDELCAFLCSRKNVIAIADAVVGMEGNGPTGGDAREIGGVMMSRSPFCLDVVAEEILGFPGQTGMLDIAAAKGYCPRRAADIEVVRSGSVAVTDYRMPETAKSILRRLPKLFGGSVARFFGPRPDIDYGKCVGCGECVRACPRSTIAFIPAKKPEVAKRQAKIDPSGCIKCFCCQELCPYKAVKVVKNPLLVMLK